MSKYILLLFLPFFATSQNTDLSIQILNKNIIEILPGSSTNIAVMIINNSNIEKEIKIKINTPMGWSSISDSISFYVNANSKKIKIFTFYVQENTIVGINNIQITAFNNEDNNKIGILNIPVSVLPKYKLLVNTLPLSKYVFSGDIVKVRFLVQNLSNVDVTFDAEISNINILEKKTYHVDVDSVLIITVLAPTEKNAIQYNKNSVSLNIKVKDDETKQYFSSCIFDVIPKDQVKFNAYNRFPIKISGLFVTDNQFEKRLYGAMYTVYGSGKISDKNNRFLEFKLLGPDRQGNPILGTSDEYYLKYSSTKSKLIVGDNSYSLSNLTEGSRNGRGIDYEKLFQKTSIGAFINFPRFYPDINKVYSFYGSYFPNNKLKINFGLLNKEFVTKQSAQLLTSTINTSPFKWANIMFEYAIGKLQNSISSAYTSSIIINHPISRVFLNYTFAEKDFPGYISNSKFISTGFNSSLFKKINISSNYYLNHFNIALDTMFSNAPFSENIDLSLGYNLNKNNNISIGVFSRSREDRSVLKQFHYKESTARLTYQSQINKFNLRVYGAYGKSFNLLKPIVGDLTDIVNADLSLEYKINKYIFIKTNISYFGSQSYIIHDYLNYFYGGTLNIILNKASILLQYQNNYEISDIYRDRSLLALDANFSLAKNQEISVNINYNIRKNELANKQLTASISYTYTFNAPLSKKNDVGSLHGKILNHGVDNIEGIILSINGNISITDKNGEFKFPYVKSGTQLLFIDNSKSGLNSITEKASPYKIEIISGQKLFFEIGLTKAGKISGKLKIEDDENSTTKGYISTKEKSFNLIVEVSNNEEIFRVFTDNNGNFIFNDLRPGTWTIKIYERGIPQGYKIETSTFTANVISEKTEDITVIIKKTSRKIKFQTK